MKVHPLISTILTPTSALFGLGVGLRQRAYDGGHALIHRIEDVKVISVGNLRAGGSGKSPVAAFIAGWISRRGISTALLSRGYGGSMERRGGLVSGGEGPLVDPEMCGDEAHAVARMSRGVMVRVGADRVAQCRAAASGGTRVVVLDDGFQHRRLHRDLDILMVCPQDLSPRTRFLPAGPLREKAKAASRADLIVGLLQDWEGEDNPPPLLFDYRPTGLADREGGVTAVVPSRVMLMAGIERPRRFERTAREAGFEIAGSSFFPDHHRFSAGDVGRVERAARIEGADMILTTEKDMSRLATVSASLPIAALRIDAVPVRGKRLLEESLERVIS